MLALIPVVVHAYLDLRVDDCDDPGAFMRDSALGLAERADFMQRHFDAERWREGNVHADLATPMRYAIVRSFDPKRIYHRPHNVFLKDETPSAQRVDSLETPSGALPVHRALYAPPRTGSPLQGFAAWLLLYQGEAIASPVRAQLLAAPGLAFAGSAPMTLALVWGRVLPRKAAEAEASAYAWLESTYRDYQRICRSGRG
jgi:hypothetical protein